MGRVDREHVKKLGELAHVSLTEEECGALTEELEVILAYAEQIQSVDTEGVSPISHSALEPALRDDVPRPGLPRERVLEGAPDASEGLFKVPKVLP
ncbi:MAG TPA: Asp-tRNA(Asn)/Glu-tRNA(Gln) amidotransferase subunit GatC [Vicinamibacteria bacterium]|nr:Asp-tRNA(Asn)/Glu-tRNA(Gln) amidotransferase subunit GatC [Vicinamibacteria bacterium]